MSSYRNLFDQVQVGYIVVESQKLSEWKRFGRDGFGLHLAEDNANLLAFRMDSHQRRLVIRRGPAEDIAAFGLQLRDEGTLQEVLKRLAERNIEVTEGSEEEAALRGVTRHYVFSGPKRLQIELFTEALTTDEPLQMLSSGFVTGAGGMGHVAITSRRPEKMRRFWQEIFDARTSDTIEELIVGNTLDLHFLRLNERHHSVAIASVRDLRLDPIRTQVQHINLVANSLDDVGSAFRRLQGLGFEMAHEIGQHPNDKEISFYAISPSGFEFELGCMALTVDETNWKVGDYFGMSLWGHKPSNTSLPSYISVNAGNFRRGLKSLLHPEYSPL
uniref:2,3-dihydroxybiphenyl dioxygenase n=1 Tax=uncultured bacterium UPO53 TaxID=1776978 RepID=A0A126T0A9_9BACT|nr:2,3-dihydroxybiphenyl dioxygenase [uncultured bacterium UPO53]